MKQHSSLETRELLSIYSCHGGAWPFLNARMIEDGFSEEFAEALVSSCRYRLGAETQEIALLAFDTAKKGRHREETALFILALNGY